MAAEGPGSPVEEHSNVLRQLREIIEQRKQSTPDASYTAKLLHGGVETINAKVLEEAQEVCEAALEAEEPGRRHTIYEAADLIYHLWVLLAARGIAIEELEQELARRFGVSGLAEKAGRRRPTTEEEES